MDPQTFLDIATTVTKLKMYPYFDIAHFVLMCMAVRDDIPQGAVAPGRLHYSIFTSKNNSRAEACNCPRPHNLFTVFEQSIEEDFFTVNGKIIPQYNSYFYKFQFTTNNGNACKLQSSCHCQ